MLERGWGTLSTEDWGKGILPRTVNKQAGQAREAPAGARAREPGAGKLVRVVEGRKLYKREGGRPTSHMSCKQACSWQEQQHCPATRSRKACESGGGRKTPQERGEDPLPTGAVNKHAGLRKQVQCHLPQCAWKGESL
jgi:hypothetical protein